MKSQKDIIKKLNELLDRSLKINYRALKQNRKLLRLNAEIIDTWIISVILMFAISIFCFLAGMLIGVSVR